MQVKDASKTLNLALHTCGDFSRVDDLAGLVPPLSGQFRPGVASLSLEMKDAVSIVPSRTRLSQAATIAETGCSPAPCSLRRAICCWRFRFVLFTSNLCH